MIAVVQRSPGPKLKPTAFTNVKVYCISDPQGGHLYKRDGEDRRKFWKELLRGTNSYITNDLLWVSLTVSCEYHSQPEYTGSVHIFLISTKTACFTPKRYGEHPPSFWYGCLSPGCQPVNPCIEDEFCAKFVCILWPDCYHEFAGDSSECIYRNCFFRPLTIKIKRNTKGGQCFFCW